VFLSYIALQINLYYIEDSADIFAIIKSELLTLPLFKDKKADNVLESINQAKKISLAKLLFALGIRFIGEEMCFLLSSYYLKQLKVQTKDIKVVSDEPLSLFNFDKEPDTITKQEKFFSLADFVKIAKETTEEDLLKIDGIGDKAVVSFVQYFTDEINLTILTKMVNNGVFLEYESIQNYKQIWQGMSFVVTGTVEGMTRDQIKKEIQNRGGKNTATVSKKVSVLIAGKNPGSKFDKAEKMGIDIWGEEDFLKKIK
jgi:DNA ligase (NAD+)